MRDLSPNRRSVIASLAVGAAAAPLQACGASNEGEGRTHLPPTVAIEAFGAVGDRSTDDTAAFRRAFNAVVAGTTITLSPGRNYRVTGSLRFPKPLILSGSIKDQTLILFDRGSYESLGGQPAAIILPHTGSGGIPRPATAQRSHLSGFSAHWVGGGADRLHGMLVSAPIYVSEVDLHGFPSEAFRVEGGTAKNKGNANGSTFINCSAKGNGGHGFALYGDDANACLFLAARAFDNRGAGFYDASLLGNTYVGAEVDNNEGGGYTSAPDLPNNSVYLGCYAEPGQEYRLNNRNIVVGPLGHTDGHAPAIVRSLPNGEIFTPTGMIVAGDATAATTRASVDYSRLTAVGLELGYRDGQNVRMSKLLSEDYVDLLNGNQPVLRLPARAVTGNVDGARPLFPAGFTLGGQGRSGILGSGVAAPRSGTFAKGALWLNEEPAPGGFAGWVCIESGAPGRWCGFGLIEQAK